MSHVVTQGDRSPIRSADSSLGPEKKVGGPADLWRIPAHAGILGQSENISAGGLAEQFLGQRQLADGSRGFGQDLVEGRVGLQEGVEGGRVWLGHRSHTFRRKKSPRSKRIV